MKASRELVRAQRRKHIPGEKKCERLLRIGEGYMVLGMLHGM